jgi:hypothetical protein
MSEIVSTETDRILAANNHAQEEEKHSISETVIWFYRIFLYSSQLTTQIRNNESVNRYSAGCENHRMLLIACIISLVTKLRIHIMLSEDRIR